MNIEGLVGLPGIGLVVFAVTDIDDLFVLVAFFSDPTFRARQIIIGQFLGIAVLIAASALSYLFRVVIPGEWIGLIGLVPLALGTREAVELRRELRRAGRNRDTEKHEVGIDLSKVKRGLLFRVSRALAVAAVTVANGGDNLGVYVPLFAASEPLQIALLAAIFFAMTGVWLGLAWLIVGNRLFGHHIRRYGRFALPIVLVGLGVYILVRQRSWVLVTGLLGG